MRIIETFENQRPLDHSPWREAGGDWIFLICAVPDSDAAITIGVRNGQPAGGDARLAWSEAILRVSTPASADEFLKAFSTAFHHQLPARLTGTPRCFLRIPTAVFGTELGRLQEGGFEGKGFWTATKWFLQSDERDAEVFFNFNIREKWAEFSEKDPDYRDDLISQLVTELRDGPLPSGE